MSITLFAGYAAEIDNSIETTAASINTKQAPSAP
jgi:hypothetical protein